MIKRDVSSPRLTVWQMLTLAGKHFFSVPTKVPGLTVIGLTHVICPLLGKLGSSTTTSGATEWDSVPKRRRMILSLEDIPLPGVGKKAKEGT